MLGTILTRNLFEFSPLYAARPFEQRLSSNIMPNLACTGTNIRGSNIDVPRTSCVITKRFPLVSSRYWKISPRLWVLYQEKLDLEETNIGVSRLMGVLGTAVLHPTSIAPIRPRVANVRICSSPSLTAIL
jgi:hypothetical protein